MKESPLEERRSYPRFKRIEERDLERVVSFLGKKGLNLDYHYLRELLSRRKFYGVILEVDGSVRGVVLTDPFNPPRTDELYGVKILKPFLDEGYEDYQLVLLDLMAQLVPVAEVTMVLVQADDDLELAESLLERGFELTESIVLKKVIA